ncbi:hypothetical protein NU688_16895 [Variovorax sp. ZS18.2.2]|uniref:hypothetical protein n=1 Tax=Variovorax sp. ZS18.2.2 TaxID=2971255 RepID=UPI002151F0BB|nr:hypothetical protein [Variovorax sp. ZS18.2.2]MCR6477842.1 hypothetical protein [Variovorax sp. ZS18.2.2]
MVDVLRDHPLKEFFPTCAVNTRVSPVIRPRMRAGNREYEKNENNEYADCGDLYNFWRKPGVHRIVRCFKAIPGRSVGWPALYLKLNRGLAREVPCGIASVPMAFSSLTGRALPDEGRRPAFGDAARAAKIGLL